MTGDGRLDRADVDVLRSRMLDAEANILRTFLADRKNTLEPVVQA